MKYFVGLLAIVALVAGATVAAYNVWDNATHTKDDNGGVLAGGPPSTLAPDVSAPPQGQVTVTGIVTAVHLEGAVVPTLATPFTVETAERGQGGATFTPVQVGGKSTAIDWQAGQPLPLSGDGGSLTLGTVSVDASADGISLVLDGVQGVAPGTYQIATSVAVGSEPKDSVTFTATAKTTVQFRGGARTPSPTPDLTAKGTGNVTLEGTLTIAHPDRSTTSVPSVALDQGDYTITLTPAPGGGFTVQATLQGTVR